MKKFLDFLASLQLAVILIVALLVGLAVGTVIESRSGVETAGNLVYYSWWFLGLQALFAINVTLSIAERYPWGKWRIGFVIVHASLLLIFAGSAVSYFFKIEGRIALWEGEASHEIIQTGPDRQIVSRHELPFSVKLGDFVLETYPGTSRPSGFRSVVQITDLDTNNTFASEIWMNNELHHRGYALFQSSYQQQQGREATVLSVSKDPGQIIVFAGYILLVIGMIVVLFTRIEQARAIALAEQQAAARWSGASRTLPGVAAILTATLAAMLAVTASAAPAVSPDLLRRLPVQHDGRAMPLDTFAREAVWNVTGSYFWNGEDPTATVTGWLFDPQAAAEAPLVKIGSSELASSLGLSSSMTHASFHQLVDSPRLRQLTQDARRQAQAQIPRKGVMQDAEKLEERLVVMQEILQREAVRPIPVPGNPNALWAVPSAVTAESLAALASGPRQPGWPPAEHIDGEILYNQVNPVRLSWIILLVSLVLSVVGWNKSGLLLDRCAFGFLIGGFAMMSWGIWMRWLAGDRIPAANMYESMLFLAWGVGFFAVIAYGLLNNKTVVMNAAIMAALTMALTDLLPIDRFIHPIAPVLAGTPWLAIHVPIIMVAYSVLALGLVIAHMQIGFTIFKPRGFEAIARMSELLYWYMFVGSILLIAGIFTGSMWAASSWGRYWGWDPKEVWSLVAFLAYMAILHAKHAGYIARFGIAVVSILAFQTIIMTYLGVNFVLATGMHSYGMGDSPVVMWMVITALVETAFLLWGWAAYRRQIAARAVR
ncbi:MAG: cytochrome c biogenesis protein CcsA [Deltaproteobacteria bacterium]|nr:cytochrome c biogenesis protein CcsA [Deltaproteobacteria bacterium]